MIDEGSRGFRDLFIRLHERYGPQGWWPAETRLEIIVGAVLTQNTAWTNVERAIANLRAAEALSLRVLLTLPVDRLAELIRPAGYFNLKARRLRNLLEMLHGHGGEDALAGRSTTELRELLLAVNGVGPETADDILLYAYHRPVFVVDAYTRRLFFRLGQSSEQEDYESLRDMVESAVPGDESWYQEFHALIVIHAKEHCRPRPRCVSCPLWDVCPSHDSD